MQSGKIATSSVVTCHSNDVELNAARCLTLNYTSENGFSGGPLFSEQRQVVGMMSMVVPTADRSAPTKSIAISAPEISELVKELE
jgi:hypothetical protein